MVKFNEKMKWKEHLKNSKHHTLSVSFASTHSSDSYHITLGPNNFNCDSFGIFRTFCLHSSPRKSVWALPWIFFLLFFWKYKMVLVTGMTMVTSYHTYESYSYLSIEGIWFYLILFSISSHSYKNCTICIHI